MFFYQVLLTDKKDFFINHSILIFFFQQLEECIYFNLFDVNYSQTATAESLFTP